MSPRSNPMGRSDSGHQGARSVACARSRTSWTSSETRAVTNARTNDTPASRISTAAIAGDAATANMTVAREFHSAALLPDGRVLFAGGVTGSPFPAVASAEIYDANVGLFYPTGSMGAARTSHTATLLPASAVRPHGKVLVAGGGSNSGPPAFASAELYDPDTGLFSPTGSMSTARWNHTATLLPAYEMRPHGRVLLAGGDGGSFSSGLLANAELYDPDTGSFSTTDSMSTLRHQHSATLLPNGKLLIAGGDNFPNALASAELYAPPQ